MKEQSKCLCECIQYIMAQAPPDFGSQQGNRKPGSGFNTDLTTSYLCASCKLLNLPNLL